MSVSALNCSCFFQILMSVSFYDVHWTSFGCGSSSVSNAVFFRFSLFLANFSGESFSVSLWLLSYFYSSTFLFTTFIHLCIGFPPMIVNVFPWISLSLLFDVNSFYFLISFFFCLLSVSRQPIYFVITCVIIYPLYSNPFDGRRLIKKKHQEKGLTLF